MKRVLLLSACALFSLAAAAQVQVKAPNMEALKKSIEKSNTDIANPKKMANPKTWVARAEMFMDVYDKSTLGATQGMNKMIFATLTKEKKTETVADKSYEVLVLPSIELYFEETGALAFWKETKKAVESPLSEAKAAFDKAIELDVKKSQSKKIKEGLEQLALKNRTEGVNAYSQLDHKTAQKFFMESVDANANPLVGKLDSLIAYYVGLMALMDDVNDYDNAIKYLNICVENSYFENGDVYLRLAIAYKGKKDKAQEEKMLVDGFLKFPKNQSILIELINMYLGSGDDATKVLPFLHKAQENEPANATLYFAEATLYEKLAASDSLNRAEFTGKAEGIYKKTIEMDAKNYNAYYNLGALYYNKGVECGKQANAIKDWKDPKIKELEDQANVEFKRALEPFIKAHEVQPNDKSALETIKNIYYRFRNESPEMMEKYNTYNEKFQQLEGAAAQQ
ncbi:MAG: hypothetical protein LBU92_03170 [Prevotellaceae bacterium]|jgi:tetratricopeptide (TPR) repeat protein|nr:hypothetical protein [Prevotellaceae bacterium]